MEHSSFDLDTTGQLCIAALYAGITLIVRAASKEPYFVSRILDGGALGVIVPHIKTVQDARDVVAAAKFQPVIAATDGPLLLSGATKRAGEMASLSARSRATNGLTNGLGNTTTPSALAEKLNGVKVAVVEQLS
ncbi:uncharacterized protein MYCGRDRAFT_97525 [Zymoseptoria tritici IPO323]|uniref:Uncharacterized protein n=1 Tax=Zymoseptoria tritici (strain CBS 115943 / IPO323) TaxID=336722 RepID=F9XQH8_ZYMTI|nr:uncharacterized protein MYCGRDRAFT_97525 [Zymoseptoria tritici IPO323]EGP82646.1 hypothetical protein MYCGRDRAFT_97525 [Zymoseptoria tritici IPO323]